MKGGRRETVCVISVVVGVKKTTSSQRACGFHLQCLHDRIDKYAAVLIILSDPLIKIELRRSECYKILIFPPLDHASVAVEVQWVI